MSGAHGLMTTQYLDSNANGFGICASASTGLQVAMRMGRVEFMTHQSENALLLDMVVTFVAASIDCS